jgi:hypothetical protein
MGYNIGAAYDPSVADYRATSPRWRAGRNMIANVKPPSIGSGGASAVLARWQDRPDPG